MDGLWSCESSWSGRIWFWHVRQEGVMPAVKGDQLQNIQGMGLTGFKKERSHLLFVRVEVA